VRAKGYGPAVEQADHLVAEVIKRVAEVFAHERGKREARWSQGNQVDTEQLASP
jgi:hypothetical protein